jgi:hypothetical protein
MALKGNPWIRRLSLTVARLLDATTGRRRSAHLTRRGLIGVSRPLVAAGREAPRAVPIARTTTSRRNTRADGSDARGMPARSCPQMCHADSAERRQLPVARISLDCPRTFECEQPPLPPPTRGRFQWSRRDPAPVGEPHGLPPPARSARLAPGAVASPRMRHSSPRRHEPRRGDCRRPASRWHILGLHQVSEWAAGNVSR